MKRDLEKIASGVQDILVIGGGAHGAAIAYHAASAGYQVAMIDKNDFCSATSANSLKILHGGLRYLQHLNIKRMRHSITARREMMRLAPHLVQPLPCVMPVYGHGLRGKRVMQAALFVNDCIGWDRNKGLAPEVRLPSGFTVSKQRCQELIPSIRSEDLQGASIWHDALAVDSERLIMTYVLEAANLGALIANYTEATAIEKDKDGLHRVTLQDRLKQQTHRVTARFIINAAGPWIDNLLSTANRSEGKSQKWAMALNIISRKQIFGDHAVALEGKCQYQDTDAIIKRGKRLYFFVPWRGYTMIGTEYQASTANPDCLSVRREDIQDMINNINTIYPAAQLRYEDISFYHVGLLPMRPQLPEGQDNVQLEKNSLIREHDHEGFTGIFSVKGVKYTTAPFIAGEIVHLLQKRFSPAKNADKKMEMAENDWQAKDPHITRLLKRRYGRQAQRVGLYLKEQDSVVWIDKKAELLAAEVKYLIHEEMACTLSDIVLRRTGLGTAECPAQDVLAKIVAIMAEILGWDEARKKKEMEALLDRYSPLTLPVSLRTDLGQ